MNLAINARDAMPRGGRLTIETADIDLDEAFAREHPGAGTGPHVRLSVIDDGLGMSAEIQARIFEPFFTTKDKGRGTGLGLSMVYGIVQQHGGYIGVRSGEGQGTTFDLYLPCASPTEDTRAEQAPARRGSERSCSSRTRRTRATREIRDGGYTVLEAARGDEALRLCLDAARSINLLLIDVAAADERPELARKMLELRPGTKVVYMSGYTDTRSATTACSTWTSSCCPPFTPEALMQHLRPGRIREARLAQRTSTYDHRLRSMTKRMRGRSVSEVETLAEIGVVKVIVRAAASRTAYVGTTACRQQGAIVLDQLRGAVHPGERDPVDGLRSRPRRFRSTAPSQDRPALASNHAATRSISPSVISLGAG
jgi:hypothetical protein